eukprot:c2781_g1_i1 orf=331-837(-)
MAVSTLGHLELTMVSGTLPSGISKLGQVSPMFSPSLSMKSRKYRGGCSNRQLPYKSHKFCISAEYGDRRGSGAGEFVAGFVLGGVVFGALGYLFAPQVTTRFFGSKEGDSESTPTITDDDEGIAKTRRNLNEKIAKLNAAIDNVSAQLRADNGFTFSDDNVTELESAA